MAQVGTAVHAFAPGEIFLTGFYPERYDYGHVVVTRHTLHGQTLWALHGHLSAKSLEGKVPGAAVEQGEVIGWMGDKEENGEWFPHTHFQLVRLEPVMADIPGVVAQQHRDAALAVYPDPRLVLGPLW